MTVLIRLLLLFICFAPKINIIAISNSTTGIRGEDFLIAFICIIIFTHSKKVKSDSKEFAKIKKIFTIYMFFSAISSLYGIVKGYTYPIVTLLFFLRKIEYFFVIYAGYYYASKGKFENKFDKLFDICVIFNFVFCLLQSVGFIGSFNHGEFLETLTQGRVSSTFNGAYELSGFLLLLVPYYLKNIFFESKYIKKSLIYLLLITFCMILSQSRTSLVIEIIVFLLIFKDSKILKKPEKFKKVLLFIFIIIIPIFLIFYNKLDFSRFENLNFNKTFFIIKTSYKYRSFDIYVSTRSWHGSSPYSLSQIVNMGYDGSLYERVSHWMQLLDGWFRSPLWGVGVSISGNSADGNYVKILAETGILGLFIWLWLLFYIYKVLKKSNSYLKYSLLTMIIGALLIDVFDSSKIIMMFWFLLGYFLRKETYEKDSFNN